VINTDKSEILELGNYKYCVDIGIPLVKMAKITGIWFSEDYQLMSDTNWKHVQDGTMCLGSLHDGKIDSYHLLVNQL
jgi:hypothetical protein